MKEWMTLEEVCEYTRLSKETIYRKVKKKQIPCVKLGRLYRFNYKDIQSWMSKGGK